MQRIVTFGEVMMRLSPPGYGRFLGMQRLDVVFGGGEANVAVSLARFGLPAAHVTCFPDNELGRAAAAGLRGNGVHDEHILFRGERLGLYFLESGAAMRAGRVVYDRAGSAFARLDPAWFDWENVLRGAGWFHWTGITPAISANAAQACAEAVHTARRLGVTVSADVNYRRNLWQYGKTVQDVMPALVEQCDLVVCAAADAEDIFDIRTAGNDRDRFQEAARQLMRRFPNIRKVIATHREMLSATHNRLSGRLYDGIQFLETPVFDINPIVDRIGSGDAFMAGFIYGALVYGDDARALTFATAASALKHTIPGDCNLATVAEVEQLAMGDSSGRLLR